MAHEAVNCTGAKINDATQCPEEPSDPNYDETMAQRAIMYANAAYGRDGGAVIPQGFEQGIAYNFSDLKDNTTGFMYTGVDTTFKEIIISFRGTTSTKQLIDDFIDLALVPFVDTDKDIQGGIYFVRLATGLLEMYNQTLINFLQTYPDYSVLVAGHSLGGSLATINNMMLSSDPTISSLLEGRGLYSYTIGEARAGNVHLADTINKLWPNSFRLVADLDPIPHLPECIMDSGKTVGWLCSPDEAEYWHHYQEVWYPFGEYVKVTEDPTGLYAEDNKDAPCGRRMCTSDTYHGEDWSCSDQYPLSLQIQHHFDYWGTLAYGFCNAGWGFETFTTSEVWDSVVTSTEK